MSSSNAIVPEVLTEKNYGNWKVWLKSYLIGQGLWDIVDGIEAKPVENHMEGSFHLLISLTPISSSCFSIPK
ncbi:hypothetical protein MRB53_011259 [Persea americana]|uniref:Uncharacterized protein n=1 Tax=Persea americana TaxID=3435 RepID=A0ACC2LV19_PERAE|nr:hypothetical protein MRB53_011259 [Persea americana]